MDARIDIIGIGADGARGLRPDQIERILSAHFLAGGERHLNYFPDAPGQRFIIKGDNLALLLGELANRSTTQRCVVLASGDPMFFGIANYLAGTLGREAVRIEPAVSSMQLAFARAGIPWEKATLASIHGRDLRRTLLPLLGQGLIGLFTNDGDSPASVARFFIEHGVSDYEAFVGENLGAPNERLTRWTDLQQLLDQQFASLNYLILSRPIKEEVSRRRGLVPGVPDEEFVRPETGPEVMTRQEVRSVLLGKLSSVGNGRFDWMTPAETIWDIGAGLGTVAVEIAVLHPQIEVLAVERDSARAVFLRENRMRFGTYNMQILQGQAPEILETEDEKPRAVFIGGSGQQLSSILDLVAARLKPRGRLLASFVTLENLTLMLGRVQEWGWPYEITEIHIARSDGLAGLTGLKPQRGVFLVVADKPSVGVSA
jgi:precorrin-6Y C5,15-methyltransferase (decarboxylating)